MISDASSSAAVVRAPEPDGDEGGAGAYTARPGDLERRMQELFEYFSGFKRHLDAVQPTIAVDYPLLDACKLVGLSQERYALQPDDEEQPRAFTFRCVCAKPGGVQVKRVDAASAARLRDYLDANGLRAKVHDGARGAATFLVELIVPVAVDFELDREHHAIVVQTRNLAEIGTIRYSLSLAELTDQLLDELARAILRKPNRFQDLACDDGLTRTGKIRLKKRFEVAIREQARAREREVAKVSLAKRFGRALLGSKRR